MADELWVDVLPSMRGFGSDLVKKATSSAKEAGSKAGKEYSAAFSKGSGNAAQAEVKKLEAAQKSASGLVSKLSGDVSKARQAQQKSAASLLVAEQRLNEAIAKHGPDSAQAQAAALRLEAARGKAADETARFENAEHALKEAQKASKVTTEQLEKAQAKLNNETKKSPGLWGKLKRGLGDTDAAAARTRKTFSRLADGAKLVGKGVAIGAAAVGAFAVTLAGMAIKGGIDRALNIEDARASLTGLGHDTKAVDKIMQSALASVKGTAFGLGDAATIAATAVAAGIEPGEKLTEKLKLTANAAALARVGLDEMGSILNKVWTSGRVSTEELNQLADKGVPIWTKLAEAYGVSGTELRTMVSKGKVDAETFADVLTNTVGTAADEMGNTTRGMWSNFKASLGRAGEVIAGPFLTAFKDGMGQATPLVDKFTDALKPIAETVGERLPGILKEITGGFRAFIEAFKAADGDITSSGFPGFMEHLGGAAGIVWDVLINKVVPALQDTVTWVKENRAWLEPLTVALVTGAVAWKIYDMAVGGVTLAKAALTKVIPAVKAGILGVNAALRANPIGVVVTVIGALVGVFIYLWKTNEGFRNFFLNAWEEIKNAVKVAGEFISGILTGIGDFLKGTFGPVFTWLNEKIIQPVWNAITGATEAAGNAITDVLGAVGGFLKTVFGPVFSWLHDKIIKPVWGLIQWQIEAVSNVLLFIFDLTVYTLKNFVGPAFKWLYDSVIKPVWSGIQKAIQVAWAVIKAIFTMVVTVVKNSLGAVFTWLRDNIIKPVWTGIQTAISLAWTGIKVIFGAIKQFLEATLGPVFRWLQDKVINPVWNGIKNTIKSVWDNGIKPVFTTLGNFITDRVVPAFEKGVEMIGNAWDGIKKAAGTPVYFVLETVYNKGIKAAFDKVAGAIGSKASLPEAKTSGIPHFAKGGQMDHGWKLVGEEGPELIHTGPGYVYTAKETKRMLAGKTQAPDGAMDSLSTQGVNQNESGIGGFWGNVGSALSNAASSVRDTISGAVQQGISWVRGGLAKAAEALLKPARSFITGSIDGSSVFGGIVQKVGTNAIDDLVKWIKGEDDKSIDDDGPLFTGVKGGFARPSRGPITSGFGARRGKYSHAGIDIAGGGPTYSAWNGRVQKVGTNIVAGRTGIGILIDHGNGLKTYYGHNPVGGVKVKAGQEVKAGQRIGAQGATGNVTGIHLHWETWRNGKPHNPAGYLRGGGGGAGASLYDNGGVLQPGYTPVLNKTRKPEAIYTHSQNTALQVLAKRGAESVEGSGDINVEISVKDLEGIKTVEEFIAMARRRARQKKGS